MWERQPEGHVGQSERLGTKYPAVPARWRLLLLCPMDDHDAAWSRMGLHEDDLGTTARAAGTRNSLPELAAGGRHARANMVVRFDKGETGGPDTTIVGPLSIPPRLRRRRSDHPLCGSTEGAVKHTIRHF